MASLSAIDHMVDGYALHEVILDDSGTAIDYRFLEINLAFEEMTGLSRDIVGKTVLEVMPGTEKIWIEKYGSVAMTGVPISFEQGAAELGKFFKVNAYQPKPGQFACLFVDISEQIETQRKLARSEAQLRGLLDNSRDVYLAVDLEYHLITANTVAVEYLDKLLNVRLTEGSPILELYSEDLAASWKERYDRAIAGEDLLITESWDREGLRYDSEVSVRALTTDGKTIGVTVVSRDMTEYNRSREKVQSLLDDKEVLLREVHHRIKNNIYTVRSMLEIQAAASEDQGAAEIIRNAAVRLGSMMTLYEKLYRGEDFRKLAIREFFTSLFDDVLSSHVYPVKLSLEVADVSLDARTASTLGIIVNELLANSLKHAFQTEGDHRLVFSIRLVDDQLIMEFADNGPGSDSLQDGGGFGMELLSAFTDKLKGSLKLDGSAGFSCELVFPFEGTERA